MKHNRIFAAIAAVMLLTMTACGAKNETAEMTLDAPAGAAAGDASGSGEKTAEVRTFKTDGAAEAAPEAEVDAGDAEAADDYSAAAEADGGAISFDAAMVADAASSKGGIYEDAAGSAMLDGILNDDDMSAPEEPPVVIEEPPVETEMPSRDERIGMLTAGEWRDHDNWGFFSNLVNTDVISFPSFGIDPTQRVTVNVTDAAGAPAKNVAVKLLDADGNPIWNAMTDQNGRAYLFAANGKTAASVSVEGAGDVTTLPAVGGGDAQGNAPKCSDRSVDVVIGGESVTLTATQIMFIVDTTGSMSDEMLYLQSDFKAIAEEVGDGSTEYAALFYKDSSDDYVTRYEGFTADPTVIKARMNYEMADGGGDEPEAVAEAFTQAFVTENWRSDAVKVAFLIYDAPPHDGREAELQTAIETAAANGIHVVPVVSSNGSRETELFGRACAICTNGSYVFLTDDSGIGGSHLEPIIGDYEVEKLHDIIVRIIQEYKQS